MELKSPLFAASFPRLPSLRAAGKISAGAGGGASMCLGGGWSLTPPRPPPPGGKENGGARPPNNGAAQPPPPPPTGASVGGKATTTIPSPRHMRMCRAQQGADYVSNLIFFALGAEACPPPSCPKGIPPPPSPASPWLAQAARPPHIGLKWGEVDDNAVT